MPAAFWHDHTDMKIVSCSLSFLWLSFRCLTVACSMTLMMVATVYTMQQRETRASAPIRIGEERAAQPFLVDYAQTRSRIMVEFLREKFPDLGLPEPVVADEPGSSVSLEALRARTVASQQSALQQASN